MFVTCFNLNNLNNRQFWKYKNAKVIPEELQRLCPKDKLEELTEKFPKSNRYKIDQMSFAFFENTMMLVEGLTLTFLGYMPFVWDIAVQQSEKSGLIDDSSSKLYKEIIITLFFIILISMHDTIVSFPFELYKTFVIEQKHGRYLFMRLRVQNAILILSSNISFVFRL